MDLIRDGARHYPGALRLRDQADLEVALTGAAAHRPGERLAGNPRLLRLLAQSDPIGSIAATVLGPASRPVRAILFNKTQATNWALGWHQDRTISVRRKVQMPGL